MKVFVSYAREDSDLAERLSRDLSIHGLDVWFADWKIAVGESLLGKIGAAIEEASFFCVVLSSNSIESEWVQRELGVALSREFAQRHVIVFPLLVSDVKLPPFLLDKKYADFRSDYTRGLRQVLEALRPGFNRMRAEAPQFNIDFGYDFREQNGAPYFAIVCVQHGTSSPHVVHIEIAVTGKEHLLKRFELYKARGFPNMLPAVFLPHLLELVQEQMPEISLLGPNEHRVNVVLSEKSEKNSELVQFRARRMGGDVDEDIKISLAGILKPIQAKLAPQIMAHVAADEWERYVSYLSEKGDLPRAK